MVYNLLYYHGIICYKQCYITLADSSRISADILLVVPLRFLSSSDSSPALYYYKCLLLNLAEFQPVRTPDFES